MNADAKLGRRPGIGRALALRWRKMLARAATGVDHQGVDQRVGSAGVISGGYLMMTAISAAIAILGLLLSSPAVIIGAMLLSPLMGPIVLLGFSFWTVDWASTRKALTSLGIGFAIALAVSVVLTFVSPLKEPTAEILARSRPTLFDLLVAIFSGLAGGYAVVRGRGETVIGVAIATALMPPLAVVGFGVGTRDWAVCGGALLLFFTNLIAIALAAAVVAAISGFRPRVRLTRANWVRHLAVVSVLAMLCVPLTLSLGNIALEDRATAETRTQIVSLFGPKARVASLRVRVDKRVVDVTGLIATQDYVYGASARLSADLKAKLQANVRMNLGQVVLADPSHLAPAAPAPAVAIPQPPDPVSSAAASLRAAVPFADTTVSYDPLTSAGVVLLGAGSGLDLLGARALENGLRQRPGEAGATVVPPVQPLPPIGLMASRRGQVTLASSDLQRWALSRWRVAALGANLCDLGVGRLELRRLALALTQTFSPLSVELRSKSACSEANAARPFVIVAPADQRVTNGPSSTTSPTAADSVRPVR